MLLVLFYFSDRASKLFLTLFSSFLQKKKITRIPNEAEQNKSPFCIFDIGDFSGILRLSTLIFPRGMRLACFCLIYLWQMRKPFFLSYYRKTAYVVCMIQATVKKRAQVLHRSCWHFFPFQATLKTWSKKRSLFFLCCKKCIGHSIVFVVFYLFGDAYLG